MEETAEPQRVERTADRLSKCPLCGSAALKRFATFPAYALLKCTGCNTLLKDPPAEDPLDARIDDYEALHEGGNKRTYERILEAVRRQRQDHDACLDIGCATGWFLELATAQGWQCHGIDISAPAIAKARLLVPNGQFAVGRFAPQTFPGRTFGLITLLDVLEHLPNPHEVLRLARERLHPDGRLVIRVPVIDSLMLWLAKRVYDATRGRYGKPLHLLYRYHLIGFSTSSIVRSLRACGFQVTASWRENSIDPTSLAQRSWATSRVERALTKMILAQQRLLSLEDEIVVVARTRDPEP